MVAEVLGLELGSARELRLAKDTGVHQQRDQLQSPLRGHFSGTYGDRRPTGSRLKYHFVQRFREMCNQFSRNRILVSSYVQSAAVGVAAATDASVAALMRSLTLIAPDIYRGHTASTFQQSWFQNFRGPVRNTFFLALSWLDRHGG